LKTTSGQNASGPDFPPPLEPGTAASLSDGQLLDRFVARREESVFEAIVLRHGPMVWGVCRRVLRDHHDAEDALQATFLTLARKAASVEPREKLGNWLYGVAYLTAKKAMASRARRRVLDGRARETKARENKMLDTPHPGAAPGNSLGELLPELDRALSRLPDKYRAPVVLCELQGKTHKEAAEQLGWPIGTVSGRLSRARGILARKLSRPAAALSGGSLAAMLARDASAASVPAELVGPTAQAACQVSAGHAAAAGVVSAEVATLTAEVLKTMLLSKIAALGLLAGLVGLGGTGIYYGVQSARGGPAPGTPAAPAPPAVAAGPAVGRAADDAPKEATKAGPTEAQRPSTPAADGAAKLQGTWNAVRIEIKGRTLDADAIEVRNMQFIIEGDRLTIPGVEAGTQRRAGPGGPARRKRVALDAAKTPKQIDLTSLDGPEEGETAAGIYQLENGRLTIAFPPDGHPEARPKGFKAAADGGIMVVTLERANGD
jgi:RNA polymerase sigma factor (sigma-70 family)